jgi:hypothetical protein
MSDDDNPMHKIGHGRGDDYSPRKTSAYSFVQPPEKKLEPTQPMQAVDVPLTVKDVISRLIEVDSVAWRGLPQSVKDALIERPQDFQFVPAPPKPGTTSLVTVSILYNGVVLRYDYNGSWVLDRIVR